MYTITINTNRDAGSGWKIKAVTHLGNGSFFCSPAFIASSAIWDTVKGYKRGNTIVMFLLRRYYLWAWCVLTRDGILKPKRTLSSAQRKMLSN